MRKIASFGMMALVLMLASQMGVPNTMGQTTAPTGEDAKRFIGTWRIVSEGQVGVINYDPLGNMQAQVMRPRTIQKFAGAQPTPDEAKAAVTSYLAYFGTYTVDERAHTITHHRKGSLDPGQVGGDAVRQYQFEDGGDRLIYITVENGGKVIWERAK